MKWNKLKKHFGHRLILLIFLTLIYMTSDATTYITTNTLLSSSYAYLDEVVVDNNAILTITGASTVVSFRNNVTIKPGSKLMINMGATAKLTQRIFLENATSQSNGAELQG